VYVFSIFGVDRMSSPYLLSFPILTPPPLFLPFCFFSLLFSSFHPSFALTLYNRSVSLETALLRLGDSTLNRSSPRSLPFSPEVQDFHFSELPTISFFSLFPRHPFPLKVDLIKIHSVAETSGCSVSLVLPLLSRVSPLCVFSFLFSASRFSFCSPTKPFFFDSHRISEIVTNTCGMEKPLLVFSS